MQKYVNGWSDQTLAIIDKFKESAHVYSQMHGEMFKKLDRRYRWLQYFLIGCQAIVYSIVIIAQVGSTKIEVNENVKQFAIFIGAISTALQAINNKVDFKTTALKHHYHSEKYNGFSRSIDIAILSKKTHPSILLPMIQKEYENIASFGPRISADIYNSYKEKLDEINNDGSRGIYEYLKMSNLHINIDDNKVNKTLREGDNIFSHPEEESKSHKRRNSFGSDSILSHENISPSLSGSEDHFTIDITEMPSIVNNDLHDQMPNFDAIQKESQEILTRVAQKKANTRIRVPSNAYDESASITFNYEMQRL